MLLQWKNQNKTTHFLLAAQCVIGVVWWQYCYFLFGGDLAHVHSIGIIVICHGAERPKKLIMLKCSKKRFRTWSWEHYNPAQAQCDLKAHCSISVVSSPCLETFSVLQTKVYFLFWIRWYDVWKKYCFHPSLLHKLALQGATDSEQVSVGSAGKE